MRHVPLQQLAKKIEGCGLVASPLNKNIQHLTLAIDGAPQIHASSIDRYDHFIEMPPVVRLGSREPQVSRHRRTKLQDPAADGLVANAQTSRGQQILDVSVAQGEPQIEPNGVANDSGREAVAGVGNGAHHHSYPIHNATVTMPDRCVTFRFHSLLSRHRRLRPSLRPARFRWPTKLAAAARPTISRRPARTP